MREIKFRAWDGKKMTREYTLYEMLSFQLPNNGLKHNWLQYTGLKDKNGKKIFEGDIIEWVNWSNNESKLITIIEYEDDYAAFFFGNWYERSFPETSEEALIIGNIYENPELLDRVEEIPIMKGTREALDKIVI